MPIVLLMLAATAGAVLFACLGALAARWLVGANVGDGHNDVSSAIFQAGGTVYAVFLAFLVVAVWESYDAARANVAEEASLLGTLYRGSVAMEPVSGGQLRGAVRAYTQAVIDDEWARQAKDGGASAAARSAGLGMFRLFGAMDLAARQSDTSIDQVQLGLIAQVQADRNKRTLQAQQQVSPVIWGAAIANGALVILMSFFLYADRHWPHVMMSAMLATMIAVLLCVVFIFDRPFSGLMPLKPDAFTHSLDVYRSVDNAR